MPLTRFLTLCTLLALAAPAAAQARKNAANDPDMKEIASYTMTMDALNKVDQVNRSMIAELKKDPRYAEGMKDGAELEALQKKDDPTEAEQKRMDELQAKLDALGKQMPEMDGDAQSLSDMEAKLNSFPPMAKALRENSMSAREYSKFMLAMIQAAFAAGFQKSGMLKDLPPGVNAANVKFVQEHEADLKRLQDTYSQLGAGR